MIKFFNSLSFWDNW